MPGLSYERFGLTGNPFRDLASESQDDLLLQHVSQDVDRTLESIREEVADKENHAVVAILGEIGAGKTERLRVTAAEARERKILTVYVDVPERAESLWAALGRGFRAAAQAAGLVRLFGTPAWYRGVAGLERPGRTPRDPAEVGQALRRALNESAPSVLLLNDLHTLEAPAELSAFARAFEEVTGGIRPGVLVMLSAYEEYFARLRAAEPALASKVNRTFVLRRFRDDEAALLLAKKLLAKRVVEDLDPTYPFDLEAVAVLNAAALGNPRRLLEEADFALEHALARRAYRIEAALAREALAVGKGAEGQAVASTPTPSRPVLSSGSGPAPSKGSP